MKLKEHRRSCVPPWWYVWRNKYFLLVFAWLFLSLLKEYKFCAPSFPHWARISRLVKNVDKYSQLISLDSIQKLPEFDRFATRLAMMKKAPYIIFFDSSNYEVTLNHICNLKFVPGAMDRFAAVSFEPLTEMKLNRLYPEVPTVTIDFSHVKKEVPEDLENKKYVTYQLVLMLRARIAAALAYRGLNFWAMQQDTIWTDNFSMLRVEDRYPDHNLIFDTVGNDQFRIYNNKMFGWICGSTFFVRGNRLTAEFFQKVAHIMTRRQSPDSSIMTYLCGAPHYKCLKLPRWVISNSNFFMGDRKPIPLLIQVDHDSPLSKMDLFRKWDFGFKGDVPGECNVSAVANVKRAARYALPEVRQVELEDTDSWFSKFLNNLHQQYGLDPYNNKNFLRVHESLV